MNGELMTRYIEFVADRLLSSGAGHRAAFDAEKMRCLVERALLINEHNMDPITAWWRQPLRISALRMVLGGMIRKSMAFWKGPWLLTNANMDPITAGWRQPS